MTTVTDNELSDEVLSNIWDSFFHFFLDKESHSFLIAQCQTLIEVSESIAAWNDSKYSKFLRMCDANTLLELRRHWERYVLAGQLPAAGKKRLREMVSSSIRTIRSNKHKGSDFYPCRSAGPYFLKSTEPASQVFEHFWKTGITSLNPRDVSAATLINPTFMYSLTGEGLALHYGTTPIAPFHLAPAFLASNRDTPAAPELCAEVSTMSLLLDLSAPINYLSNFNTRSNAEEILATKFLTGFKQYHERIAWKRPTTGDPKIAPQPRHPARIPISFEPHNPGKLLFDIYLKMFASDDTMSRLANPLRSLRNPELVHYIRETFAVFLAIVKRRVNVDWDFTMASFFNQLDTDMTLMMGMSNYQDLCTHLHLAEYILSSSCAPRPQRRGGSGDGF